MLPNPLRKAHSPTCKRLPLNQSKTGSFKPNLGNHLAFRFKPKAQSAPSRTLLPPHARGRREGGAGGEHGARGGGAGLEDAAKAPKAGLFLGVFFRAPPPKDGGFPVGFPFKAQRVSNPSKRNHTPVAFGLQVGGSRVMAPSKAGVLCEVCVCAC